MQMEAECSYFLVRLPCVMRWQYTVMRGYAVCGKLRQGQTGQVREPFLDGPVLPRYCLEVLKMAACAVAVLTAMLLRAGAEVAQSEAPDPFVSFGSLNRAFAVLDESPEYIERFRSLDPGEDTAAIDGALAAIFPEGATRDEAGVLRILSYAAQAIRLEATTTPLGSEVLKQGHAYCNGIAIAFVALCRRAGLPARVNAFHNLEWMEGHNAAEVHYDGAWRFFDPTYGAFYYSTAAYDGAGRVLGLRELAANAGPRHGFQVTRRLWKGTSTGGSTWSRLIPRRGTAITRSRLSHSMSGCFAVRFQSSIPMTPRRRILSMSISEIRTRCGSARGTARSWTSWGRRRGAAGRGSTGRRSSARRGSARRFRPSRWRFANRGAIA